MELSPAISIVLSGAIFGRGASHWNTRGTGNHGINPGEARTASIEADHKRCRTAADDVRLNQVIMAIVSQIADEESPRIASADCTELISDGKLQDIIGSPVGPDRSTAACGRSRHPSNGVT